MPSGKSTRRLLPFLQTTDAPQIHAWGEQLATALDNDVEGAQGTLAARPAAALRGRIYVVQGDATPANNGIVWWDTGSTWLAVNNARANGSSLFSWGVVGFSAGAYSVIAGSGDFTVSTVGAICTLQWSPSRASENYAIVAIPLQQVAETVKTVQTGIPKAASITMAPQTNAGVSTGASFMFICAGVG